jgi:hypothetical protein
MKGNWKVWKKVYRECLSSTEGRKEETLLIEDDLASNFFSSSSS